MFNGGYDLSKCDLGIRFRQTVRVGHDSGVELTLRCVFKHDVQFGQRFDDLVQSDNVRVVQFLHAGYFARQKAAGLRIQTSLVQYLYSDLL